MPHVELPQAEFKVVILGDKQVGKTSLVMKFVDGGFRENRSATVGAFFITKRLQIGCITCKVQIWDTAGQTKFRPLARMYYSQSAAAILCFDASSRESWQVVKYWLEELHRNVPAGNIVLCLCACKMDFGPVVVSKDEAIELANSNGAMYLETSAKTNHNIIETFERVAERVLQFQKSERETGLGNIPVTSGAVVDLNGNILKSQLVTTMGVSNGDSYRLNEEIRNDNLQRSTKGGNRNQRKEGRKETLIPSPKLHRDQRSSRSDYTSATNFEDMNSSSQHSIEKRIRFERRLKEVRKEIATEAKMCGIVPWDASTKSNCTLM